VLTVVLPILERVEKVRIECLSCGARRSVVGDAQHLDPGECARCGYVGWARSEDLTDIARRLIRERPLERRSLRVV
jgi:ribosomal protein S27AE